MEFNGWRSWWPPQLPRGMEDPPMASRGRGPPNTHTYEHANLMLNEGKINAGRVAHPKI